MKNVPVDHARQVGLAVVDFDGLAGLELFDHPDFWRALSKSSRGTTRRSSPGWRPTSSIQRGEGQKAGERLHRRTAVHEGESVYKEGPTVTYEIREKRFTASSQTMEAA